MSREGSAALIRIPVALVVLLAFWPVLQNGFVNLDDPAMLLANPHYRGLGRAQLAWMFTAFHLGHYQPLSWLSLALDHALWGMDPRGYHVTSLLLHAGNALLVYSLAAAFQRLRGGFGPARVPVAAALAALLFAVHPLRVESVAWVTERRDVLSTFFLLLTLLAWLRVRETGETGRVRWYAASLACFTLSLLAKSWGMTLPIVLLVLDRWPLRRRESLPRLVAEKIPFILLALAAAVTALAAQRSAGAMPGLAALDPLQRLMQAAYGLGFYVRKTLWPVGLSPVYLLDWTLDPGAPRYVLSAAAVVLAAASLLATRRRWPGLLVASVCYAILVSPVLGLTQAGIQIVADRYTYVACIPFALLASATPARAAMVAALAAGALLGPLTWQQARVWRDSESLWTHAVALDARHWFAYQMRGAHRLEAGAWEPARADLDASVRINPVQPVTHLLRARARAATGDLSGALADWDRALELQPGFFAALFNRGVTRLARGDTSGGTADLEHAVRANPGSIDAWYHLAAGRVALGQRGGAAEAYRRALAGAPPDWALRPQVERALAALGTAHRDPSR